MAENVARVIYVFGELTKMEVAVNTAANKSRIPTKEIKHLLNSMNKYQADRTPLFQYLAHLFKDIGLGELHCAVFEPYRMVMSIYNSKVPKLFSDVNGKTCYITADAIKMFLEKDMDISAEVEETTCINEGNDHCEFEIKMNPLDVLKYIIEEQDISFLTSLKNGGKEELDEYRKLVLERHGLIENGKITILGEKYLDLSPIADRGEIHRPWKQLSEISEVTASANSFAEAFARSIDDEVEEVDEDKLINVVDEVESSRSFAELVAKVMKKEVKDDE